MRASPSSALHLCARDGVPSLTVWFVLGATTNALNARRPSALRRPRNWRLPLPWGIVAGAAPPSDDLPSAALTARGATGVAPGPGPRASAAGDEGDDGVGGVAVVVLAAPVVHGGGAGIGVAGGDLHVA